MNILVIGGTRFFGIDMVNELLTAGHDVTIATRGKGTLLDSMPYWRRLAREYATKKRRSSPAGF